jgi:peptidoglycan/xylan/chitin deacetylase (PgdA/CDA1 family)
MTDPDPDRRANVLRHDRSPAMNPTAPGAGSGPVPSRPKGLDLSTARDTAGYVWAVMWTVGSLGWRGIPAAEITTRRLTAAEPGAIYLFHVRAASADADALPTIVEELRTAGYGFATVAAMTPPR